MKQPSGLTLHTTMLSNSTSSIQQKRRQQHRRQNSMPTPTIPPLPATLQEYHAHRRGMSLDQSQKTKTTIQQAIAAYSATPSNYEMYSQNNPTVSNMNNGPQPTQHSMQETQQHRLAQPGMQQFPIQENHFHTQHPQPTEEQIRELQDKIKSVYGGNNTVYLTVLPTPAATPHAPRTMSDGNIDLTPIPYGQNIVSQSAMHSHNGHANCHNHHQHSQSDLGYESTYHSSVNPSSHVSPTISSTQSPNHSFASNDKLVKKKARKSPKKKEPAVAASDGECGEATSPPATASTEINLEECKQETGITEEDIQQYIGKEDPTEGQKWICLWKGCGKPFGRKENIRAHVQTHLDDRTFYCPMCPSLFVRIHDLKRHVRSHDGLKPHVCPCGSGFARQDALTRHRQRGLCSGAFPDAVKRPEKKRGRPPKKRPEMDERVEKASKTRKAVAEKESRATYAAITSDDCGPSNLSVSSDVPMTPGVGMSIATNSMTATMSPTAAYGLGIQTGDLTGSFSLERSSSQYTNASQSVSGYEVNFDDADSQYQPARESSAAIDTVELEAALDRYLLAEDMRQSASQSADPIFAAQLTEQANALTFMNAAQLEMNSFDPRQASDILFKASAEAFAHQTPPISPATKSSANGVFDNVAPVGYRPALTAGPTGHGMVATPPSSPPQLLSDADDLGPTLSQNPYGQDSLYTTDDYLFGLAHYT